MFLQEIHMFVQCWLLGSAFCMQPDAKDDHSLKCWGSGAYGRLGLGSTASVGTDINEMGDHLPAVDLGSTATGPDHSKQCLV